MKGKSELLGLDLIRFFAAILVMLHHLGFWMWAGSFAHFHDGGYDTDYHQLAPYTWFGWIGVEIFFILSGFLIAYSANGASALAFARNRVVRLYPSAWVCSSLTAFVLLASGIPFRHAGLLPLWIRSFFLFPAGPWIDGSYWTLGVEISFYFVIFVALAVRQFNKIGLIMTVIGFVSTSVSIYLWRLHSFPATLRDAPSHFAWYLLTDRTAPLLLLRHGQFFAIGTLLWLCLFQRTTSPRLFAIGVCSVGALFEIIFHSREVDADTGFHFTSLIPAVIWIGALGAIIRSVRNKDQIAQFFGDRGSLAVRKLAVMTYPLYLLHQIIGYRIIHLLHGRIPDLASLAIACATLLLASYLIATYLEKPLQVAVRVLLGGSRHIKAPPAATAP